MKNKNLIFWITMIVVPLCLAFLLVSEYADNKQIARQRHFYFETLKDINNSVEGANLSLTMKMCEMQGFDDIDYQLAKYLEAQDIFMKTFQSQLVQDIQFKVLEEDKIVSSLRLLDNDIRVLKDFASKWMKSANMTAMNQNSTSNSGNLYAQNVIQFGKYNESFIASINEVETQISRYFDKQANILNTRIIITLSLLFVILAMYGFIFVRNLKTVKRLTREKEAALVARLTEGTEIISFVNEIINENFNVELHGFNGEEVFAKTLNNLKDKLKAAANAGIEQQVETERRTWNTHGLALFSETMRDNTLTINDLSINLISNLVKYIKANQGGIFILNDDNKDEVYLELTGFYAFERRKFRQDKIKIGEGLVGMCFLERKTTLLNEIPDDYIRIKSGLGDAPPKSIVIVPLTLNDEVYGVIEIASFTPFEQYQIDFIEKLGESICATIKNVKTSHQTAHLLEISRQQAENMRAQEEEMRQNMEELSATQEEMERKGHLQKEAIDKLASEKERLSNELKNKISSFEQKTSDMVKREEQLKEKIAKLERTIADLRNR